MNFARIGVIDQPKAGGQPAHQARHRCRDQQPRKGAGGDQHKHLDPTFGRGRRDDAAGNRYDIGIRTIEQLTGGDTLPEHVVLRVERSSAGFGILRNFETRLGGKTFIATMKSFVRPDGDPETHFHFARDGKDVQKAVLDAAALASFKE